MILAILTYRSPQYFLSNFESMGLSIQEKRFKTDSQDGNCGGHLVFPIETILAIFDLQVTLMILTKFKVSWPFGSEEEVKNRFSGWPPLRSSWISDHMISAIFDPSVYQVLSQLAFRFRRSEK